MNAWSGLGLGCLVALFGLSGCVGSEQPTASSDVIAGEALEVRAMLASVERACTRVEEAIREDPDAARRSHEREVAAAVKKLAFLEAEAADTLRREPELQRELERLTARMGRLAARLKRSPRVSRMHAAPMLHMSIDSGMRIGSPALGAPMPAPSASGHWNREAYGHYEENPFLPVRDDPLSTFSVDVDTASYSNLRRMISREGRREIPRGAVRIEEMMNYFRYGYPEPKAGHPLSLHVETTACPWTPAHRLARIGLQARSMDQNQRKPSNLVFLIDSSGSMDNPNKIGLLKQAYSLLIEQLDARDRVAVVTYAGSAGLVLPSTTGNNQLTLGFAVEELQAGGSTAGAAGIRLAYQTARDHFIVNGNNRVILATDGDFNVGVSSQSELVDLIEGEARSGVFLTVLGFGTGNYQDARMEALSNHGNGNYAYIDNLREARKVFLTDLMSTLYTVCKDVKIQVEFNPAYIEAYRLLGYENRQLADRDFADDRKDAGEVGAGHQVTALYEVVPAGTGTVPATSDGLRYQSQRQAIGQGELMQVRIRYKQPDGEQGIEYVGRVTPPASWAGSMSFARASADTRFAASVAAFGMILRDSPHKGDADSAWVQATARQARGQDPHGYRDEFVALVEAHQRPQGPAPPQMPPPVYVDGSVKPIPYTVVDGDTLEDIARLFIVKPEELRALNNMKPGEGISPGRILYIPPSRF